MTERKLVVPGEIIQTGDDYLPGEWTIKQDKNIIAQKFGLAEVSENLVKIIPLSGVYEARRGNVVIGRVDKIISSGWFIDIGTPENAFLSVNEYPKFVPKGALESTMAFGEMVVAKIWNIDSRGIDLSLKQRGLGILDGGIIIEVNAYKVPRIIGKEGSMVKLLNDKTRCNITVGQNGKIWIRGDTIEDELLAKKAIEFIVERSFVSGLTEEVEKFFGGNK